MTLNEKEIQRIAEKHGISRTEVDELIKTNDFTNDNDNLKVTENSKGVVVVLEVKPTSSKKIEKFVNKLRPGWTDHEVSGKRHHFYYERHPGDFTDDASGYNYNLLRELADSWKIFATEKDPEKSRRAHQLFRELFEEIKSKLNELDTLKKK